MNNGTTGSCGRFPSLLDDWPSLISQFSGLAEPRALEKTKRQANYPVDAIEYEDKFVLLVDVPGISRENIDISLDDGTLTLTIERESKPLEDESAKYVYQTRPSGKSVRQFRLPDTASEDEVQASLSQGVLKVEIGKKPEKQPRVIEIKQ